MYIITIMPYFKLIQRDYNTNIIHDVIYKNISVSKILLLISYIQPKLNTHIIYMLLFKYLHEFRIFR